MTSKMETDDGSAVEVYDEEPDQVARQIGGVQDDIVEDQDA